MMGDSSWALDMGSRLDHSTRLGGLRPLSSHGWMFSACWRHSVDLLCFCMYICMVALVWRVATTYSTALVLGCASLRHEEKDLVDSTRETG